MLEMKKWTRFLAPMALAVGLLLDPASAQLVPASTTQPVIVKEARGKRANRRLRRKLKQKNRKLKRRNRKLRKTRRQRNRLRRKNNQKGRRIAQLRGQLGELRRVDNQRYQALMAALQRATVNPGSTVSIDNDVVVPPSTIMPAFPGLSVGDIRVIVHNQEEDGEETQPVPVAECKEECEDGSPFTPDEGEDDGYDRGHEDGKKEVADIVYARLRDDAEAGRATDAETIQALLKELGYKVEVREDDEDDTKSWMAREGATLQDSVD
jgi:hypothetical protein